jgi:hypothetical protein
MAVPYLVNSASAQQVTTVSITPPSQGICDASFTINVDIYTAEPVAGVQFDLSFNSSLITAGSITESPLLSPSGCPTFFMPGTIDNVGGTITWVAGTVLWQGCNVSDPGTFTIVTFTAGTTAGTSLLDLFNVQVVNTRQEQVSIVVNDGSVLVGELTPIPTPMPSTTSTPTQSPVSTSTPTQTLIPTPTPMPTPTTSPTPHQLV